jgi:SagB-type dehydrogenase family enzyme
MPELDSLQTSPALVIVPAPSSDGSTNSFAIFDYISKSFEYFPTETLYWLSYFKTPKSLAKIYSEHPNYPIETLMAEIETLRGCGFLLSRAEISSGRYADYVTNWKWDITSALFHFTVLDNEFLEAAAAKEHQLENASTSTSPQLWWRNSDVEVTLPAVRGTDKNSLIEIMRRRRTNRTSSNYAVSREELGKCLYAGLGIIGEVKGTTGWLPISMTPSGGARNPYEAFILIRRGKDIAEGLYHYSAVDHSLQKLETQSPNNISGLLANQEWTDDMAAIIILVAVLERTMWKYSDPNAYRVVLIEAGHIAQNIMLAATELDLSVCPTAAIAHSRMSKLLQLKGLTQVPIYALTLDKPKPYQDELRSVPELALEDAA